MLERAQSDPCSLTSSRNVVSMLDERRNQEITLVKHMSQPAHDTVSRQVGGTIQLFHNVTHSATMLQRSLLLNQNPVNAYFGTSISPYPNKKAEKASRR